MDNNILTDFMELTAALEYDFMDILNQLFTKIIIPTPILEDELLNNDLGSLEYEEGIFESELGYRAFMDISTSNTRMAKQLSEYDRYVIAIAIEYSLLAVSNDKPLREVCRKYGVEVTGTIGIIVAAYENQLLSFQQMQEAYIYLFSDQSSCYLSNKLKKMFYDYYSIEEV